MLVEFSSSSATAEGHDLAFVLHVLEPLVNHSADPVGFWKRRPRRQHYIHLDTSLVERRQKVAAELCYDQAAYEDHCGDGRQNGPWPSNAELDCNAGNPFQEPQEESFFLALHELRLWQEPVGEDGSNGQ